MSRAAANCAASLWHTPKTIPVVRPHLTRTRIHTEISIQEHFNVLFVDSRSTCCNYAYMNTSYSASNLVYCTTYTYALTISIQ